MMNIQGYQKPLLFTTDVENQQTYVYVLNGDSYEKKHVYIPTLFETMSQRCCKLLMQIVKYRQAMSLQFLFWSFYSKKHFTNPLDHRIALSRFIDLNTNVTGGLFLGYAINSLLQRVETPFMDFYFDDMKLKFPQIKRFSLLIFNFNRGVAYVIGFWAIYKGIKNVISNEYIFDLALEYKEFLRPQQLTSQNCEEYIKPLLPQKQ